MLRLKRHIVTEVIEVFFAVIVALILIMVSFQFAKLLSQAASGKIVGSAVYQLVALQAVNLFVLLTPFAFFIAMLIALSRLASDNELIAMRAAGYSEWRTYQALLTIALPLAGFIVFMTLQVLPHILSLNYTLLNKAQKESELSIIQPGQFRTIGGKMTLFVADVDDKHFSKFFVWQNNEGTESVTVAKQGNQYERDEERYIDLQQGSRYTVEPNGSSHLLSFSTLTALLPAVSPKSRKEKMKAVPTATLLTVPSQGNRIELQRRISPALSILLLTICAPLLVQFNPRENRYGKFVTAILIYALYANSQYIFQALIEDKQLPIVPGIYTSHLVFGGLLILWVWWRFRRNRPKPAKLAKHQAANALPPSNTTTVSAHGD